MSSITLKQVVSDAYLFGLFTMTRGKLATGVNGRQHGDAVIVDIRLEYAGRRHFTTNLY